VLICNIGRAWKADELRLKSFDDLHKLWWVLVKEMNLLLTQKNEARRRRINYQGLERIHKCRLSMARIKTILTERQRAQKLGEMLLIGKQDFLEKSQKLHDLSHKMRARGFRKWKNWNQGRSALFT
jgi:ribosomal protein L29